MYRNEHPNPQFERDGYECLNGVWGFSYGKVVGRENCALDKTIQVPFCPESELSGIGNTELNADCVYTREIEVKKADLAGKLWLKFGAVDYEACVYVNGAFAGKHAGGYTAFDIDITPHVKAGKNRVTVAVHDDVRENVPSGKQTAKAVSFGCFYTRVTGIWQTVWLERTPLDYIKSVKFYPDAENGKVKTVILTEGEGEIETCVTYRGRETGRAAGATNGGGCVLEIPLSETHLWEAGCGRLYDVSVKFGADEVKSYFGLRSVECKDKKFLLNGKSVFQRLVLDQGYYPSGVYTAQSSLEMREDISRAMDLGFNGARLHQKVFEQRFLYECDKAGYLVWGEYASWGVEYENTRGMGAFLGEWTETVEQYFNHPSIITWCPLNETWENIHNGKTVRDARVPECAYAVTKILDPTRPCVDTSGGYHGRFTDIADFHSYEDYRTLKVRIDKAAYAKPDFAKMYLDGEQTGYGGEPLHLSEFGGVTFTGASVPECACVCETEAWGYNAVADEAAFVANYVKTVKMLLACKVLSGFCYTQLYDVEQEQNGFYTYDRKLKLSAEAVKKIAECNRETAATEADEQSVALAR